MEIITKTRLFVLSLLIVTNLLLCHASIITYTPDDTTIFKNPERGYAEGFSKAISVNKPNVIKGKINSSYGDSCQSTLIVLMYNFRNFKEQELPQEILTGFDEDMAELRQNGLKCVLRFAYSENENDNEDATPGWVSKHLKQLNPYLIKNADVIYVLEAGFVGVWGEWYYTSNYGNQSQQMNANRRMVIDSLFKYAPTDRFILFRYPLIKTEYLNDNTPLTKAEGFSGSVKARMGHHNDAFLNKYGDNGTYASDSMSDDPNMRQYIAIETFYVPNGGESNIDADNVTENVYAKAPVEMAKYHWSFYNLLYANQMTSRWKSSGIFDSLNIHMGYRYNLLKAEYSDLAAPNGKMNVTIFVRNSGYAPIYNERPIYIVLKGNNESYSLPLSADIRRWLPNGAESVINEQVNIPADIPEGQYQLYLSLPDKYKSLSLDSRYAIRFANTNVWDSISGMNDLNATIVISKEAPLDPGDLQHIVSFNVYPQGAGSASVENSVITAIPNYGYHFTQWSDGITDNPRAIVLTQDTTFIAEFAVDRYGECGNNMALTWEYDPIIKTLTFSGKGALDENVQYGVEARGEMKEVIFNQGITSVGSYAFANCSSLQKVVLSETVNNINDYAFSNCENLTTIYNYRSTPTSAHSTSFDGVDKLKCSLYVLANSINTYKAASVWQDFSNMYAIGAEEKSITSNEVTIMPTDNTVVLTWPTSDNAVTYTIEITQDGVVFSTLTFNANGQLTDIAFAPGRNGKRHVSAASMTATGMQFTITGLNSGTNYAYTLTVKNNQNAIIASYTGKFTTTGGTPVAKSLDDVPTNNVQCTKLLRDGQIYILRGNKTYTLQGQEVK